MNTTHKPPLFPAIAVSVLLALLPNAGAQLITNGDFESWGTVSGTPPTGVPTGWTVNTTNPIQGTGLVAESDFSAILRAGNFGTNSGLSQNVSGDLTDFSMSMVVASAAVTGTGNQNSNRSFQLLLNQGTGQQFLNLRLTNTSATPSSGFLSLQVRDGAGATWVTLAPDAFSVSVFDAEGDDFTTLNAYNITISGTLSGATSSYSITYGLVGGGTTTISDLSYFSAGPTSAALTSMTIQATQSTSNYAIDDIVVSVPEPSVFSLIGVGVALSLVARKRYAGET